MPSSKTKITCDELHIQLDEINASLCMLSLNFDKETAPFVNEISKIAIDAIHRQIKDLQKSIDLVELS